MTRALATLAALALASLAAGCMGEATREILLPKQLAGAVVTADGEPPVEARGEIEASVPLRAGEQVVRVEPARARPLVERVHVSVNDPKAPRTGVNVIAAKLDEGALHRTKISGYEADHDPLSSLGHDFEPPVAGEGVVLVASEPETRVAVDGAARADALPAKPGTVYDRYKTRAVVVRLAPGRHKVEFGKAGFEPCAAEVEVRAGEYEVLGATLAKLAAGS
jgi:hypothetical protein